MCNQGGRLTHRLTGVPGLDSLLHGGLVNSRLYLVLGVPGTGKTTLGMQFLRAGLDADEDVLFIHGEESQSDLLVNAAELGIDLADADFLDIGPESDFFAQSQVYDVVEPHDVEDGDLISDIRQTIEDRNPDRVLIDSISHLRYIEPNEYQFRKRIIAFTRFLTDNDTTVLATKTPETQMDEQLRSLSDGVIRLDRGTEGRRVRVPKHRGLGQRDGTHGLEITGQGLVVHPALQPTESDRTFDPTQISSGIDELDELLGGGLERGTTTVLSGPSGVGKSTTAMSFLRMAATDGDGALSYLFEESLETFTYRAETFEIPVTDLCQDGALTIEDITPQTRSPEEFARLVESQVEDQSPDLVVIDGIKGYKTAIKGSEDDVNLRRRLQALTRYLTNRNVTVFLLDERREVVGLRQPTGTGVSYLADNLLFQQYLKVNGALQRVVGVLKKRAGDFEAEPRRFRITSNGLEMGESLSDSHGIFEGASEQSRDENGRLR